MDLLLVTPRRPGIRRLPALVAAFLVFAAAPTAHAGTPEVILDRPRVGEYQPVRGGGWIAWQQNTADRPGHYDVVVRPIEGGSRFRANPGGTNGANGDIEGTVLVYQQFERGRSGLRFFDLATRERSMPPDGVNTEHWEYWPSLSGQWLLFARLARNDTRRLILFDLSTGVGKRLARIRGAEAFLAPGQVNGDWVVWSRCPNALSCNVIRYHIPTGVKDVIANPGGRQHSPSVGRGGRVYYVRGRGECGDRVRLMRAPLEGSPEELWALPNGDDIGRTHVQRRARGATVLFDHFSCGRATQSDAWQISIG